jgi:hypothetical protein
VDAYDTCVAVTTSGRSVLSRALGDRCIDLVPAERGADPRRGGDPPEHLSGFPQQMRLSDPLM